MAIPISGDFLLFTANNIHIVALLKEIKTIIVLLQNKYIALLAIYARVQLINILNNNKINKIKTDR